MRDLENKDLEQIEQKLKARFDAVDIQSEEEFLIAIKPKLKKKRRPNAFIFQPITTKVVAVAASFVLLLGIGLTVWLTWPKADGPITPPEYRYEDMDIETKVCEKSDITNHAELYVPSLDILDESIYRVGKHKETSEPVYFAIKGYNSEQEVGRIITLTIIVQEKYRMSREEDYNTNNTFTVLNTVISVFEEDPEPPFYNYKLGFKIDNVRYYINYQTTSASQDDIKSFLTMFIK